MKAVVNDGGWARNRVVALVLVGGLLSCVALCAVASDAGKDGKTAAFSDPERVAQFFDNSPSEAVRLLEGVLSQEQVDALERAMFPEPSKEEQRSVYAKVETTLKRLGLAGDDALLRAVSARKESLSDTLVEETKP
jgi:hypothetical protein